jgi:hypothetical protein
MKRTLQLMSVLLTTLLVSTFGFSQSDVILTAVWDGNLPGQLPKGIELYIVNDVADMSIYGIGSANNGQGTDDQEFTFPAVALSAGTYVYVASEAVQFEAFFGFAPNYTTNVVNINGDDAIELFKDGLPVDVFGQLSYDSFDGTWSYLNGWAYRVSGTGPDNTTFVPGHWMLSGAQALAGVTTNASAPNPIPVGTYSPDFDGTPVVFFNVSSVSVSETAGTYDVTIDIINPDLNNSTSVDVELIGGTAIEGIDFTSSPPYTVTFAAGSAISQSLTLTIIDNADQDGDRTIELELVNATNGAMITNSLLTITILDDDAIVPLYDIATLRELDLDFFPTMFDMFGEIRGVVHGVNLRPSGLEFTLIDPTDGIAIFNAAGDLGYTVQEGDSIHVLGTVAFFNGTTQFAAESIELIETDAEINTPVAVTVLDETTESNIVKLECVTLVDPLQWTGTGTGFNVDVTNGVETFVVRIRDAVDLYNLPVPTGVLNISGIGGQFDNSIPYDSNYQLTPRYEADIVASGAECVTAVAPINEVTFSVYPNPFNGQITISGNSKIQYINVVDVAGRTVKQINVNYMNIISIDANELPTGMYFMEIHTMDGKTVKEIVKN